MPELLVTNTRGYLDGEIDESFVVATTQMAKASTAQLVYAAKAKAKSLSSPGQVCVGPFVIKKGGGCKLSRASPSTASTHDP